MAADIAQNAAKIAPLVEPVRAALPFAVRARAEGLYHATYRPLFHQLPGKHCAFDVQTLAVVDRDLRPVFATIVLASSSCSSARQRRFVGKIVFTCGHGLQPQRAALGRNAAPATSRMSLSARITSSESATFTCGYCCTELYPLFAGSIVDPFQRRPGLHQPVAHARIWP